MYQTQKRDFYAKVLPLMTLTQFGLTCAMVLFSIRNRHSEETSLGENVTFVNIGATLFFALLSWLVRCSTVASWFICPAITSLAFYYFAFLEYSQENVSTIFTIVVAINTCYFILIMFNEVWLISTSIYAPLLAYYMYKMGQDFTGSEEHRELILRCIFCIILYGAAAYSTEKSNKNSFLGQHSQNLAFRNWLKVFNKFQDGVALVQDGEVKYANQSLSELLAFENYLGGITDAENKVLKQRLESTYVESIS